jgi:DNA-binding response OmpR family regulator
MLSPEIGIVSSKAGNGGRTAIRSTRSAQNLTATRVLMIEDNAEFATVVGQLLGELEVEFQVDSAGRLRDGISSLVGSDVDVVLLDLGLPDSKGLDSLAVVRACAPHVAVVVLTGADDEELAIKALQRGAQDYLIKTEINGRILFARNSLCYRAKRIAR